jgi:hypothetical protein
MEKLVMRDGFKIGGNANYLVENWENCRHAIEELEIEGKRLILDSSEEDRLRIQNPNQQCFDSWLDNKRYSPDQAEKYREQAHEKLYIAAGVK